MLVEFSIEELAFLKIIAAATGCKDGKGTHDKMYDKLADLTKNSVCKPSSMFSSGVVMVAANWRDILDDGRVYVKGLKGKINYGDKFKLEKNGRTLVRVNPPLMEGEEYYYIIADAPNAVHKVSLPESGVHEKVYPVE